MRTSVVFACGLAAACGRVAFDPISGDAPSNGSDGAQTSCVGLVGCGPSGSSPCCGSSVVPGGAYFRSYDVGTDNANPDMTNNATVSDFRLDTYEVTVGRFRAFVDAGLGTQQAAPSPGEGARFLDGVSNQAGWDPAWNAQLASDTPALVAALNCGPPYQTWTDSPGASEALPIDCITWFEAFAFCSWDGGFLPTEAEWNYAAAGGDEQRAYPWSSPPSAIAIDCSHANFSATTGYCVNPPTGGLNRVGSESPAGDGRWGHADLAGNVWEWTLDGYATPYVQPCSDCANVMATSERVFRGGNFHAVANSLRGAYRGKDVPTVGYVGVRCARAL